MGFKNTAENITIPPSFFSLSYYCNLKSGLKVASVENLPCQLHMLITQNCDHCSSPLLLPNPMAKTYRTIQPAMVPKVVSQNWEKVGTSNSEIPIFIPNMLTTTMPAVSTTVAVVIVTPICSSWFCLSSSMMLM